MKKIITSTLAGTLAVSGLALPGLLHAPKALASDSKGWVDKAIQSGLDFDAKLINAEILGASNFSGGYRYDIEPSFHRGLVTRYDRYYMDVRLNGSNSLGEAAGGHFSVGMGLQHDVEFSFARQFTDAKKAVTAKPYFAKNIPWDSKRALEGMDVGDYFSIKAPMNLIASGNLIRGLNPHFAVSVDAYYLIAGEFQLHTVRLNEKKIRIKLVGLKKSEKGGAVGLGYSGVFDAFKIDYLNKKATSVLDFTPIRVSYNDGQNDVFMVDYVLDLGKPEVAEAYDSMMKKASDISELWKVLNPQQKTSSMRKTLLLDIEPIDQIFRQDQGASARVERKFKGTLDSEYRGYGMKVALKLIHGEHTQTCSQNKVASVGAREETKYYRLDSCHTRAESGFLFNWMKLTKDTRMNSVFSTDENYQNLVPDDIVIGVEKRDNHFGARDLREVREQLLAIAPSRIADLVDLSKWKPKKSKSSVSVRYQMVMHPEGLFAIPQMSQKEVAEKYVRYLEVFGHRNLLEELNWIGKDSNVADIEVVGRIRHEANRIAGYLTHTFNPKLPAAQRVNSLMQLKKDDLFLKTGIRFLIELMPQQQLENLVHFEFDMQTSSGERLQAHFGNRKESPIYDRLLLIQGLVNNNGVDIRLEAETLFYQKVQTVLQ